MRRVDLVTWRVADADLKSWWDNWLKEAKSATDAIILLWEKDGKLNGESFPSKVWTDLKKQLLEHVFQKKCAFCESPLHDRTAHCEHFRPKLVPNYRLPGDRDGPLHPALVTLPAGQQGPHPGYFWLAYDWRNLLPACDHCNANGAKHNQFPLADPAKYVFLVPLTPQEARHYPSARQSATWKGYYYLSPEDLDVREEPQLIHPGFEDPAAHLVFGECGIVSPKDGSPRGKRTIEVLRLDRGALEAERHAAQVAGWMRANGAYNQACQDLLPQADCYKAAGNTLIDAVSGKAKYSQSVLAGCEMHFNSTVATDAARAALKAKQEKATEPPLETVTA